MSSLFHSITIEGVSYPITPLLHNPYDYLAALPEE